MTIAHRNYARDTIKYLKDCINMGNMKMLFNHMGDIDVLNDKKSNKRKIEQFKLITTQLKQIINHLKYLPLL